MKRPDLLLARGSRVVFDVVPDGEWTEKTRRVLDACFRALRSVLDVANGGIRMREQFRCIDCVIDTGTVPYAKVSVSGLKASPLAVWMLNAQTQRGTASHNESLSSLGVRWEWRGGQILIHGVTNLTATTRYDCVIAVLE
jgi:hypothetical protein